MRHTLIFQSIIAFAIVLGFVAPAKPAIEKWPATREIKNIDSLRDLDENLAKNNLFRFRFGDKIMYPKGPDPELTPGSLCTHPDELRYPEKIKYCRRDVGSSTKRHVISVYDKTRSFHIGEMKRVDFKIDHYIPLCMGGSNREDNLWPQHRTVFEITDQMEFVSCEKLKAGLISQKEAIGLIRRGKQNLSDVPEIMDYLEAL